MGLMEPTSAARPEYQFKNSTKFQHHVKLHMMSGVTLLPWLRLLHRYWLVLDWRRYWHRILFLSLMSIINTLLAIPDWIWYARATASQQLHSQPLFILGHPRTGTTHLHNLLALDPAFAHATTFAAGFPSSFVSLERAGIKPLLAPLLEPTRPMDAMKLTWETPAEDEIAVNTLSGGISYYLPIVLPREELSLRHLLTLRPARTLTLSPLSSHFSTTLTSHGSPCSSPLKGPTTGLNTGTTDHLHGASPGSISSRRSGAASQTQVNAGQTQVNSLQSDRWDMKSEGELVTEQAVSPWEWQEWYAAFSWFMKKVTLRDLLTKGGDRPRPLLIKSPVHTARLHVWRALFPEAKYVYIHRHPLQVFQSAAHMADTYYWYTYLQQPTNRQVTDFILDQYHTLYEEYMAGKALLSPSQLVEVSFDELEADPIATLRRIYDAFGWSARFQALVPRFTAYCATLSDFKKNQLHRLSPELEQEVRARWQASFHTFGYT